MELHFEIDVRATAERIFDLIADLRSYDRWLPHSSTFAGTRSVSSGPIGVGTTYVEPKGTRAGRVVEFRPPTRIVFDQPFTFRPAVLGRVGVRVTYALLPHDATVTVHRDLELAPSGLLAPLIPLAVGTFRRENQRILAALKTAAEAAR